MGVVKLNGHIVLKLFNVVMPCFKLLDNIPQGTGHQEIFLNKPKFFTHFFGVGRIQNFGNAFRLDFPADRLDIISVIENIDVKISGCCG